MRREEEDKDAEDAEGAFGDEEAESLLLSIEEQHREQALFDAEQARFSSGRRDKPFPQVPCTGKGRRISA